MSRAELQIVLEPGPWEGEQYADCWPVGGELNGQVHLQTAEPIDARSVRVELRWHTEGRGNRNEQIVDTVELHQGELAGPHSYDWPFQLRVPDDGPISYEGHYIHTV